MTLSGTIQNGQVLLDHPADLPDGTRVTLQRDFAEYEYPHPMAPYDREKEIALLRESLALMDAGEVGQDVDEVFDELEKEIDLAEARRVIVQSTANEDLNCISHFIRIRVSADSSALGTLSSRTSIE